MKFYDDALLLHCLLPRRSAPWHHRRHPSPSKTKPSFKLTRPAVDTSALPRSSEVMTLAPRKRELKPKKAAEGAVSNAVFLFSFLLLWRWRLGLPPRQAQPQARISSLPSFLRTQTNLFEPTTSSLAAEHAPRSVRARLFAAEKKKEQQKKIGAAGAVTAAAATATAAGGKDDNDDLFSRAALDPFSEAAPAKLKRGAHTLSGPDFGVNFKEPEAAMAAAVVAAEGELQRQARADAAEAARAETARRLGKADLPKRSRRGRGGDGSSSAAQVRATRALFQPQQK